MANKLPGEITSYDLYKTLAVIAMIIDHLGYYFFPDENWFRVFGRLCVPAWFFLIGYARSRDLAPRLWIGGAILVASSVVVGHYLFPLNILFTMLIIRLIVDRFMAAALRSLPAFIFSCFMLFLIIIPTNYLAEYGSQGMLLAMFGYLLRQRGDQPESTEFITNYGLFALVAFIVPQFVLHGFTVPQFCVLAVGSALVFFMLYRFRPAVYPRLTEKMPGPLTALLQLTGRRTLEIYVGHIVLFQIIAFAQGQERFGLFDWQLVPGL